MKLPNSFVPKVKKKEIEEIIKKTLVEKILADDLGKQVKDYLENQEISRRLEVIYQQLFDPVEQTDLKKTEKFHQVFNKEKTVKHVYLVENDILRRETNEILKAILELEPGIKEEEVLHAVDYSFNITTNDFIYKFYIKEQTYSGKERKEEDKQGKLVTVYHIPLIGGSIKYLKFNKKHNEKVIQVLKDRGYSVIINFR